MAAKNAKNRKKDILNSFLRLFAFFAVDPKRFRALDDLTRLI